MTTRVHALDAVRAFALLLGVLLHATMSFFFIVPAADVSQGTVPAVTFYVIHMFRMTMFFVIAGFFARVTLHKRGTAGFIRDRARRIVVPMVAGWVVLAPATIAVVLWGLTRTFGDAVPGAQSAQNGFPLIHLWFLYYLCWLYLGLLLVRGVVVRRDVPSGRLRSALDTAFLALLSARMLPVAAAVPTAVVFYTDATWTPWFGITTPDTGLLPQLTAMVAYGTAVSVGWMLHRQAHVLDDLARHAAMYLVAAVALTAASLAMIGLTPNLANATAIDGGAAMRLAYALSYATGLWCWSLGLIGAATRLWSQPSAVVRYLADASYWIYLVHLPVVFLLQVVLMRVPLHWSIKLPLIVVVTMAVLLASYHYLVRGRLLGDMLGGRRRTALPASSEPRDVAAELAGIRKRYATTLALDGVSMAVRPGELLAVLGPNGAGKTTAIGVWLGLLDADEGHVAVLGGSPVDVERRRDMGVMMQDVALSPTLTAREHVQLAASCYEQPRAVEEVLALTGSTDLANKRYGRMSAGQKRQIQFAVAVVGRPRVLFLDEPTVGLDVDAREAMWRAIRQLLADGCAIVLTTHYLEEAEALASRVVVMAKGRVIASGTVDEMRALVTRKRITCTSALAVDVIGQWPGVVDVVRHEDIVSLTVSDAEGVVRHLLDADPALRQLEVKKASLAEAFSEITREAA